MTLLRDRVLSTPHSGIRRMLELAREVHDPLLLVSGDPNFRTPDHVISAAAEAVSRGATGYPPAEGIAPLRAAIVKKLAGRGSWEFATELLAATASESCRAWRSAPRAKGTSGSASPSRQTSCTRVSPGSLTCIGSWRPTPLSRMHW